MTTEYNKIRCITCGHAFRADDGRDIHPANCPRHAYRPFRITDYPPATISAAVDGLYTGADEHSGRVSDAEARHTPEQAAAILITVAGRERGNGSPSE